MNAMRAPIIISQDYQFPVKTELSDVLVIKTYRKHNATYKEFMLDLSSIINEDLKYLIKCFFHYAPNFSKFLIERFRVVCKNMIPIFNVLTYKGLCKIFYSEYKKYRLTIDTLYKREYARLTTYDESFIVSFYYFIQGYDRYNRNANEFEYDVWYLERLNIPLIQREQKKRELMDFTRITNVEHRQIVKKYIYFKLHADAITTCDVRLTVLTDFFNYFNSIRDFNLYTFNREDFQRYFDNIAKSNHKNITKSKYIKNLKNFISWCQDNNYIEKKHIYMHKDRFLYMKELQPRPLTEKEKIAIQLIYNKLSFVKRGMLHLQVTLGFRPCDVSILKISDYYFENGSHYLNYYMPKVKRRNTIVLTELEASIIKDCIKVSKEKFVDDAKYIFQSTKNKCYNFTSIVYEVNSLLRKQNIIDDNGQLIQISGYRFRYDVATRLIDNNIDEAIVAKRLGHNSLQNLPSYVKIDDKKVYSVITPYFDSCDKLIDLIGTPMANTSAISNEDSLLEIMCGKCSRGVDSECSSGNACLTCNFYIPQNVDVSIANIEKQISNVELALEIAKLNNYKSLINYNSSLLSKLKLRLMSLEVECEKRRKNDIA